MEKYIQRILDEHGVKALGRGKTFSPDGKIIAYSIEIPEKGNKKLIDLLKERGWKKVFRRKVRTDNRYERCQYEGYIMYITLELDI